MENMYQLSMIDDLEVKVSTGMKLIPKEMTVKEIFGFNSQIKIMGYEPGHPLVPEKTKGYVWDKNLVKDAIEWLTEENPDPVWLSGATGCGKTAFFQNLFANLNWPTIIVSAKSSTEPDDLLGRIHLVNGNTVFVPGELIKAYEQGFAIVFDEVDSYPPECMMACHRMLERKVVALDNGSIINPASRIYMAATANTRGDGQGNDQYISTNIFNLASLNRFEKWEMGYPEAMVEEQILKNEFGVNLDDSIVKAMVATAADIRLAYNQGSCPGPISIRDLLRWGRKLIQAWNRKDVSPIYHSFNKSFGNGVDVYVRQMLWTLIESRFNVKCPELKV